MLFCFTFPRAGFYEFVMLVIICAALVFVQNTGAAGAISFSGAVLIGDVSALMP